MLRRINPPLRWPDMLNPVEPFKLLWSNRIMLWQLARRNIQSRFRHSILGAVWLFLPSLCVLLLYCFVFSVVFKMRWPEAEIDSPWSFGLVIYCGMTVFAIFSETVSNSTCAVANSPNFVKRVLFPIELLPAAQMLTSLILNGIILILISAVSLATGGLTGWSALLAPIILLPLALMAQGCAWIAAALGVFHKNISNLIGIVMLVLFFTSPIFYSARMIPEKYAAIPLLNPLTPIVTNIRNVLLFGAPVDWPAIGMAFIFSLVVFQAGYACFARCRRGFADVL